VIAALGRPLVRAEDDPVDHPLTPLAAALIAQAARGPHEVLVLGLRTRARGLAL
jgi:hypothetical protein